MKNLTAAMILVGAMAPALYSLPAKAWGCDTCARPVVHVRPIFKKFVYHTISYQPVVHTHVYYKKIYRRFARHHCYVCAPVVRYYDDCSDIQVVYHTSDY